MWRPLVRFERTTRSYRTNGSDSISLTVYKESGDVLDLVADGKDRMEVLIPQLNPDVKVDYINDRSFYVKKDINSVSQPFGRFGHLSRVLSMILLGVWPLSPPSEFLCLSGSYWLLLPLRYLH